MAIAPIARKHASNIWSTNGELSDLSKKLKSGWPSDHFGSTLRAVSRDRLSTAPLTSVFIRRSKQDGTTSALPFQWEGFRRRRCAGSLKLHAASDRETCG